MAADALNKCFLKAIYEVVVMTNRSQLKKGVENGNQKLVHNHPATDQRIGFSGMMRIDPLFQNV